MKILTAHTAGFCMGVRRAVEMALEAPQKYQAPIYTYGPLIHNPQVLNTLEKCGITILKTVPPVGRGTVIIRAHGVPPLIQDRLETAGFKVIDATCLRVIKVQCIIRKYAQEHQIIILGDRGHPEVTGLLGYAGANGWLVEKAEDMAQLPSFAKAVITAQTTQNETLFETVREWTKNKFSHYKIFNTICDSTSKRQNEVRNLAEKVDAMIVVGGRNSGNTQRLVEIAAQTGIKVYHIETAAEIDRKALSKLDSIGITAGASTPEWIIDQIQNCLQ